MTSHAPMSSPLWGADRTRGFRERQSPVLMYGLPQYAGYEKAKLLDQPHPEKTTSAWADQKSSPFQALPCHLKRQTDYGSSYRTAP